MQFPIGIVGIVAILAIAFLLSANKRAIRLRVVGAAFLLQAGIALVVLRTSWGVAAIHGMSEGVTALLSYAAAGTSFLFGPLATPELGGNSFAIAALPVIIFFAALVSVLYHLGVMQFVIRWIGGAIEKVVGTTKVESLCSAANIFVGQSESPLVIRPYLARLTPSQLFAVMTVGMAGVAGTILAAYASLLGPQSLPYLLAASFMAAPGGLLMAKIMMPDELKPVDASSIAEAEEAMLDSVEHQVEEERSANLIMAAATGASTGVKIAVAVGAMVLAFVALVALANGLLGGFSNWIVAHSGVFGSGVEAWAQTYLTDLSFQKIIGSIFAPVMFLLGISWSEAVAAGGLFGTKVVLNEFVAFIELGTMTDLAPRTVAVITFALCGFANFSSIAIQMAATGSLAPNQRPLIAKMGLRALIAGSLANLMSAALAGLLLP